MRIAFAKMHGCGNDYIYLDGFKDDLPADPAALARRLSNRNFSIGSDGLVYVLRGDRLPARMRMWNQDGSEAEMCGNAIRCVAKLLYERGHVASRTIPIETKAGPMALSLDVGADGKVAGATVAMGTPRVLEDLELEVTDRWGERTAVTGTVVNVGNPHFVIFEEKLTDERVNGLGPLLEKHPRFPQRTNVEFVKVESRGKLRVRVWERGSNETLACGTGACAAFAAARRKEHVDDRALVTLPGGPLHCEWNGGDGPIYLAGPCELSFEGVVEV